MNRISQTILLIVVFVGGFYLSKMGAETFIEVIETGCSEVEEQVELLNTHIDSLELELAKYKDKYSTRETTNE